MEAMQIRELLKDHIDLLRDDATLDRAAEKMLETSCDALPVGREGRFIGVITGHDILFRAVALGKNPAAECVADYVSVNAPWCDQHDSLLSAAKKMGEHGTSYVLVGDETGAMTGLLFWRSGALKMAEAVEVHDLPGFVMRAIAA